MGGLLSWPGRGRPCLSSTARGWPLPRVVCSMDERRQEAERRMQKYDVAANTWGSNRRVGKHDGWQYQFTSSLALARFSVGIVVKEMFE